MLIDMNPFKEQESVRLEHGVVNFKNDMGIIYMTRREQRHYFVKYKGFAISKTELERAHKLNVYWIIILYTDNKGNTIPYRCSIKDAEYFNEHDNKGDLQVIFEIRDLEMKIGNKWK